MSEEFVTLTLRLPRELKYLADLYQIRGRYPSFNYTIQRLLESHPGIAQIASELYNGVSDLNS